MLIPATRQARSSGWTAWLVTGCVVLGLLAAPDALALAASQTQGPGAGHGGQDETRSAASETAGAAESTADEAGAASDGGSAPSADPEAATAPVPQMAPDPFAAADRSSFGGFRIYGDLLLNIRSVNVTGSESRFRQDFGYDNGVFVGTSRLTFVPDGDEPAGWFDRLEVFGDGLSFDSSKREQYETWGVSANKAGKYRFKVQSRTVDYFWNVSGDAHAWALERNNTDAELVIEPTEGLEVYGLYRRFRQKNSRLTTRDISRNEFEFDEPLDQVGNTYSLGARWRIGQTNLFLQQDWRKFDDNGGFGSRGLDTGLTPDEAFLTFFEQTEVRELDAPLTRGGLTSTFADGRFRVQADFLTSNQDLVSTFGRNWEGANFARTPVTVAEDSRGVVERKLRHGNIRLLYKPSSRITVVGKYRRRGWEQAGQRTFNSATTFVSSGSVSTTSDAITTAYDITVDQFVIGAEVAASRAVSLFAEVGTAKRDQQFVDNGDSESSTTDLNTYRIGGRFRVGRAFDAELAYTRGDFDDPFTRVAPTTVDTFKTKLRWRPVIGWQITGTLTRRDADNEVTPSKLRVDNYGLQAAYNAGPGTWLYIGYSRLDYDSDVPIRFVARSFANFTDGLVQYASTQDVFSLGGEMLIADDVPLSLYSNVNFVDSRGVNAAQPDPLTVEELPLVYYDMRFGVRYVFDMGLLLDVQGRYMSYDDDSALPSAQDTYRTTMFVLGVGYRF